MRGKTGNSRRGGVGERRGTLSVSSTENHLDFQMLVSEGSRYIHYHDSIAVGVDQTEVVGGNGAGIRERKTRDAPLRGDDGLKGGRVEMGIWRDIPMEMDAGRQAEGRRGR